MAISTTIIKNSYSGDGSEDTFAYQFKISADADLQVIIRSAAGTETVKTITTHYTVAGAGNANGGSITFTAGNIPTATETVVLRRAVPQTQAIDYIANDPFPAESHEEGLDRAAMTTQQIQEELELYKARLKKSNDRCQDLETELQETRKQLGQVANIDALQKVSKKKA